MKEIKDYLAYQGEQYRNPDKAGVERDKMLSMRSKGQGARKSFTHLAECFQARHSDWKLHPTSQWMNQAQVLRPAFWRYFIEEGKDEGNPSFALRLFIQENKLGVYVELSFIERKKNDNSVYLQNKVLECEPNSNILYIASDVQKNAIAYEGNESNRDKLTRAVKEGEIRKVILRRPVFLESTKDGIEEELSDALKELFPFYETIYLNEVN